ncbi:phosphatidylserine decarboxylase 1 [Gonapodya sp. JEL0774]|nr:phosphatidylserine decarboxylase 1 [Gonapodya sp. JEL0774]
MAHGSYRGEEGVLAAAKEEKRLGFLIIAVLGLLHAKRREDQRAAREYEQMIAQGMELGERVVVRGGWHIHLYATLPLRHLSRLWGDLNSLTVPTPLRSPLYKAYAYVFGADLTEMEDKGLHEYANLGEFFYRGLKPGAREVDLGVEVVSPCDGRVLVHGIVTDERQIEQVKGLTYSLDAFLGTPGRKRKRNSTGGSDAESDPESDFNPDAGSLKTTLAPQQLAALLKRSHGGDIVSEKEFADVNGIQYSLSTLMGDGTGDANAYTEVPGSGTTSSSTSAPHPSFLKPDHALYFAVVYLAPGDYHRFHSPVEWVVERSRHFVGELYSVSPWMARSLGNLFALNERVAMLGRWRYGFFSMVSVGATNVGSIKLNFDESIRTNLPLSKPPAINPLPGQYTENTYRALSPALGGIPVFRADELGGFQLGSTIVLVFEAPRGFEFTVDVGSKVKMGQAFGKVVGVGKKEGEDIGDEVRRVEEGEGLAEMGKKTKGGWGLGWGNRLWGRS